MSDPAVRPALWMLAGAVSFALMSACTSALGPRCDWLLIALVRAVFMFASTALLAKAAGVRLHVWNPPKLWVRSLAGSFSLVCNFYAMTRLPIADVLTLTNAYPLWIVLLLAILGRRAPSWGEALGIGCGVLGVILIQQPMLAGDRLAAGVAVLGSLSSAVALLGLHRLREIDTRAVVAHFAGVASLFAAVWLAFKGQDVTRSVFEPATLALLLAVGITGTLGQYCLTRAYAIGAPTRLSVIGLSQVVFGMLLDAALWGRTLTPVTLAGILLVVAPAAWLTIEGGRRRVIAAVGRSRSPEPRTEASVADARH